jgi:hypothetical protein
VSHPAFVITLALLVVAGCVQMEGPSTQVADRPRVVIAQVDTGIQPFHESFRLPPDADVSWLASLEGLVVVPSSFSDRAFDPASWDLLPNQLYWFEGTRVLGISPDFVREVPSIENRRVFDDSGHGTMTASILAQDAPSSWIVAVETISYVGTFEWIRNQSWIDVVSVSALAPPAPWGAQNEVQPETFAPPRVAREIVEQGRPVYWAAGNFPHPTVHTESGPPWVVAVGGVNEGPHGWPSNSLPPDLVGDYVRDHMADSAGPARYTAASGTSFAAPAIAALAANAITTLRGEAGGGAGTFPGPSSAAAWRDPAALRRALNLTAGYWGPGDHAPAPPGGTQSRDVGNLTLPILPRVEGTPVGPWVQMGWGYLNQSHLPLLLEVLRGGEGPPKPPEAIAYMEQVYEARRAYWER